MDSKKFNVNRIWKPAVGPVNKEIFNLKELAQYQKNLNNKAVQVMVACGPFTVSNELSYDALKDLMAVVNSDQPHVLILSGPFISQTHEDILSGDLRYRDTGSDDLQFLDYDELLEHIMNYIFINRVNKDMDVIIVPSTSEISHIYPMP